MRAQLSTTTSHSWTLAAVFSALLLSGALSSCRPSTEIKLHIRTNVACTDPAKWRGVAVYVGSSDSDLEGKAPALTSTACDANGEIGTLVVVPSAAKDDEVGVRVVAGLDSKPEDCAASQYKGCIVARRSVRFSAHDTLDLDVELTSDCINLGCDATHTCVDGSCSDAKTASVMLDPTAASVRCGDNGIRCATTGDVCCLTVDVAAQSTFGECKPAEDCAPTSAVLNCDDETDCSPTDAGVLTHCALSYTSSATIQTNGHQPEKITSSSCVPDGAAHALELCEPRTTCRDGSALCHASEGIPDNPMPGYFWCDIN